MGISTKVELMKIFGGKMLQIQSFTPQFKANYTIEVNC